MTRTSSVSPGWAVAGALAVGVVLLAASPPFLSESPAALARAAFSPFCHQMPARSLSVHGVPFALCHRCTGIVAGLALGVVVGPVLPRLVRRLGAVHPLAVLALAGFPAGVDWLLGVTGVWANTGASRLATGALFGVAAGLMIAAAFLPRDAPT